MALSPVYFCTYNMYTLRLHMVHVLGYQWASLEYYHPCIVMSAGQHSELLLIIISIIEQGQLGSCDILPTQWTITHDNTQFLKS